MRPEVLGLYTTAHLANIDKTLSEISGDTDVVPNNIAMGLYATESDP